MKRLLPYMGVCLMLLANASYAGKVILLQDDFPYSSQKFAAELEKGIKSTGYDLQIVNGDSLSASLSAENGRGTILVLPNARCYPAGAVTALTDFLKRGNHMLSISGPAFENLIVKLNDKWYTKEMYQSELVKLNGRKLIDFTSEDISKWQRISGSAQNPTEYKVEPSGDPDLPDALHVEMSKLDDWDIIAGPAMNKPFKDGEGILLFWAKGGPNTNQLKIQWNEEDGTRWIATVKLTEKWTKYALTPADFIFWADGSAPGRGLPGDKFNPAKASKISFLMERNGENPESGKPRSFWVSNIQAAVDPNAGVDVTPPLLETISPQFKMFRTYTETAGLPDTGPMMRVESEIVSPISRAPGFGADALRKWRFIPTVIAYGKDCEYKGTCAHLMLNTATEYAGSIWGAIGFNQEFLEKESKQCIDIALSMLNRVSKGIFLANAGSKYFSYEAVSQKGDAKRIYPDDDKPGYGAYILNLGKTDADAVLNISVFKGEKEIASYKLDADISAGNLKSPLHLETEKRQLDPGEYRVTTTLVVGDSVVDEISHTFNVIRYKKLTQSDVITQRDGDFYYNGKKWYPLGINYWPRYSAALETKDMYEVHWLGSEQYDPELIEKDFELMKKLKINTISVQYLNISQARPLMDFMARAEKHGIMVHLFFTGLHPLNYGMWGFLTDTSFMESGGGMIKAAHIADSPAFFAYDLGWEVIVGKYDKRKLFDKDWNKWVVDRYGSFANAQKDWRYTPPMSDGLITGPADDQLINDGEWRIFVAAYRRFWDDRISRGYKTVRDNIRTLDKYHIMGARSGYGGTGTMFIATSFPFDLLSGAKHLDFTAPEAYALTGDYHGFLKGGLNNAYGRYFSGDKPVFWPEFGLPIVIGILPNNYKPGITPEKLDAQLDFYKNMIKLTMETGANGLTGWWWPGGFRLIENSDFGIIDPDGTPRPSALEMQKSADEFYKPKNIRKPDFFLTVDRDKYVAGYAGIYTEFADKYVDAFESGKMPGIRTEGTGTTSADTPAIAVGNVRYNGKNPPKYLNSEFNYLKINGRTVKDGDTVEIRKGMPIRVEASIGNIAEAKWLTPGKADQGAVYLASDAGEIESLVPIAKDAPFLGDAKASGEINIGSGSGNITCSFGMIAKGRMRFGEIIRVTFKIE
ncbi:MAG: glycoside hydrolase 5 family protein [Armatimonadota bacterium]